MGSNTTTTQQQSSPSPYLKEPYAPLAPYLSDLMGIGSNLYNNGAGTSIWGGGANAPLDPAFQQAWNSFFNFSGDPSSAAIPFNNAIAGMGGLNSQQQGFISNLSGMSGGMTPQQQGFISNLSNIAGNGGITTAPYYNDIYGNALSLNNNPLNVLSGISNSTNGFDQPLSMFNTAFNGAQGPTAAGTYLNSMAAGVNQDNPFLNQLLDTNAQRIGNLAQSAASGSGRYGSFGMYDALNRSIAATNNPLLFQSAESERNRQLQASQLIDAARQAQIQEMIGAGQGSTTALNDLGNMRINAANSQGQLNIADLGMALNAANGMTNAQNLGIGNQLNANNMALNALGQGANTQLGANNAALNWLNQGNSLAQNWAQIAPSLYGLAQQPYQTSLGLGGYMQNRAQNDWQLAMQQFQQANMMPWTQLGLYGNTFSALAPLLSQYGSGFQTGNNATTINSTPTPWTTLAGLGIAGAGLFL